MSNSNNNPKLAYNEQEAQMMKRDFYRALIINTIFLALLIGLYFLNRSYGFLNQLVAKF